MSRMIPYVVEESEHGNVRTDPFSHLLKSRIVMLTTDIDAQVASIAIAQLLYLDSQDPETPIKFYIQSPGGQINAGMSIYDTMQLVSAPVHTIGMGMVASPVASARATVPESAPNATPLDIRVWESPPIIIDQSSTVRSFNTL